MKPRAPRGAKRFDETGRREALHTLMKLGRREALRTLIKQGRREAPLG
jgi:hypothetical protein